MRALGPVLTIDTSATDPRLVVAVELLFAVLGSVVPPGGLAVAVFAMEPVAEPETVPLMVNVTLPPAGSVGIAADIVLPEMPVLAGQAAPPMAVPQLALKAITDAGTTSVKLALLAALGPSLRTITW